MFSIFTYIMSRVTHSEPGLPMVQTAQRSSHVVDRSSHDRSTISATATSKFTTTTASPAEQLKADIVTLFVRSKL